MGVRQLILELFISAVKPWLDFGTLARNSLVMQGKFPKPPGWSLQVDAGVVVLKQGSDGIDRAKGEKGRFCSLTRSPKMGGCV